jgi:hypothetical protein
MPHKPDFDMKNMCRRQDYFVKRMRRRRKGRQDFFDRILMVTLSYLILLTCITGNCDLEPLLEGLFAQIHVDLI